MKLIGMLDSPYVRRVAIALKLLDIPFEHQSLSVFRNFEEFSQINPLVKAPTLVCDDGTVLMESTLILQYIEAIADENSLMPVEISRCLQDLKISALALIACEKTVQIYYERTLRPAEKQHQPWLERIKQQLLAAYDSLEPLAPERSSRLMSQQPMQADITLGVAWRFTQYLLPEASPAQHYPALAEFSAQAEQHPAFVSTPLE
ncbi:MAG: glutathione S-transferase [Leptolyngbyaceae cyanobacterium SM1_1_3]|nr:glutathione S-transferase [Leptolyngbyaceae cyanobacterium SM1_1_3]NJN04183.1 glutathione S-transferase [Leptolyngbyaceae cyanobacterium RM1_1_2]